MVMQIDTKEDVIMFAESIYRYRRSKIFVLIVNKMKNGKSQMVKDNNHGRNR